MSAQAVPSRDHEKEIRYFVKNASDGLVKRHCPALETEAKGDEVMLETETYQALESQSSNDGILILIGVTFKGKLSVTLALEERLKILNEHQKTRACQRHQ